MTAGTLRVGAAAAGIVGQFWWREILRVRRDRAQLFGAVSRTVLWLVILGFGLGATLREIEGYTYAQYILPGVATLNVLFASMQSAFALVYDRHHGLLRQVLVSPAGMAPVALGKILGGASVATLHGAIPLLLAPAIGLGLTPGGFLAALATMFLMGLGLTGLGILVAVRMTRLEGFGSISNGVIQPLYFLSGAIFPLKGIVGGVGFLDIPPALRDELSRYGIHAIGGGWVVELPAWIEALVRLNPISYQLDLMRGALLQYHQLPLAADLAVCATFPVVAVLLAILGMERLRRSR